MSSLLLRFVLLLPLALAAACSDGGSNGNARLRLLNVSSDYNAIDLYTAGKDADTDSLTLSSIAYGSVSDYASLAAGTYTIKLKRTGVTSTLQTLSGANLAEDSDRTYVSYGSTGHFGVMQIGEDNDVADSGYTKVQAFNTSEAGALDVYLTEASVDLEDASPVFSNVASGAASSMSAIEQGTYRLRVTGTGDTSDLRLDVPEIELANKGVLAILFTATSGGVLVNAIALPQGGAPISYMNTKVRLRAAVGIANGTRLTARVGGVNVLTSGAIGVLGNYVQIDAGTPSVGLIVDGVAAAVPSIALTAGGEYTLLLWSSASGTQSTLLADDNRLPDSGKTKIRVVNGMSSIATPITLSVDYSPLAEGIELGTASVFKQIDPSSEYQLDISDANTAANLLSRSSVSLQSGGVYTFFMASSAATATGTLRKDR